MFNKPEEKKPFSYLYFMIEKKTYSFCRLGILFFIFHFVITLQSRGQFTSDFKTVWFPVQKINKTFFLDTLYKKSTKYSMDSFFKGKTLSVSKDPFPVIPFDPSYTFQNLGWFCKTEWKFQKMSKIPLFLRLGSITQTDYLEGKLR